MSAWRTDARDQELLHRTWSDDFETLYTMGSKMYLQIFKQNPAIKLLFPWIAKYEAQKHDFTDSNEFRYQALRLVQTIAKVVEKVPHLEGIEPLLYKLGYRHVQYLADGLKKEYWVVFQDAMHRVLTEKMNAITELTVAERTRAILIWKDVVVFVNAHMKAGYEDGLKGINKYPSAMF